MPNGLFSRAQIIRPTKLERDGLARRTGEGLKGYPPRVTHAGIPGRTRAEKRAIGKQARRVLVEYRRRGGVL